MSNPLRARPEFAFDSRPLLTLAALYALASVLLAGAVILVGG